MGMLVPSRAARLEMINFEWENVDHSLPVRQPITSHQEPALSPKKRKPSDEVDVRIYLYRETTDINS